MKNYCQEIDQNVFAYEKLKELIYENEEFLVTLKF